MENLKNSYDVIIVGAGTGGTTAARFAAQKGLDVCLIDRKERGDIGNKICGDAVGADIFDFLGINPPKGEDLSCHIKGAKLYSPNLQKCITLVDPKQAGYIVNRVEFGQRLLNEAIDAGVSQFLEETMVLDLLYDGYQVNGVKVKLKNGEKQDLKAKIVVDASGFHSPIRKKITSSIIEREIPEADYMLCYREIIKFPTGDQQVEDPEYISIYLDQEKAPGGYIWYFPKDDKSVNIGLGVFPHYKGKVKDYYHENCFNNFIKTRTIEILSSGGGVVPVRRPIWSCAADGIMFVGDSGCQVNPLHGGGIDPSMRGGYYAALTAAEAIEEGRYNLYKLWDYNVRLMKTIGAEFASLDLLRIVLQKLSNASLNFGLEKDLLSGSDILEISAKGEFRLSILEMATKFIKGITNPKLLLDLNYLRIKMNDITTHYKNFPISIDDFEIWKQQTLDIYERINNATFG
jgi:geranylgeranyl reductase family protein